MHRSLCIGLALAAALALPMSAGAVLSGENGRILFASGRDADADPLAQLHLLPVPSSTGGGAVSPAITSFNAQHRHPTWSPDRTKIAYARGNSATADFDIYVQDLTAPGSEPVNITQSAGVTDDRPAWSPDGTRIAYQSEVTDGSGQTDVVIQNAPGGGGFVNFTNSTMAGQFEGKPAWTPDSSTLFYEKGNPNAMTNADIVKRPAAGGSETLAVTDSGMSEFQPSISPDGTKLCFTRSTNGFNDTADVLVAPITNPPSAGLVRSLDGVKGDYNCTWSPDGTLIAYVNGTFSTGRLVMVRQDGTSIIEIELAQDPGSDNFDGNPEWAPDARPECPDSTVTTRPNTPVTFQVTCNDTGPAYEQTNVREFADSQPANGTLTQEFAGDPFTYTPNAGFTGTDSFRVQSFDELGFGTDTGTVTIEVREPVGGATAKCRVANATIVGTLSNDTITGTPGRDVIAALGGNDVIRGGGGNDLICAGSGADVVSGGGGNDIVDGSSGRDRVNGNSGNDRLSGGKGPDRLKGGRGHDSLSGGAGRDTLDAGPGPDRLNGGASTDVCRGGNGKDRASRCERRSGIP